MATETIIGTSNNVKFIEGVTPMTQANWQEYFGKQFENRVIEGFNINKPSSNYIVVYDGSVCVNGIYAKIEFDGGWTTVQFSDTNDAFVCLRVYLNEERAELVKKGGIAPYDSSVYYSNVVWSFMADESYQCTRSGTVFEIPICYVCAYWLVDLRRHGSSSKSILSVDSNPVGLKYQNKYTIYKSTDGVFKVAIDFVEATDDVDVYYYNPSYDTRFGFNLEPYIFSGSSSLNGYSNQLKFIYDTNVWTQDQVAELCMSTTVARNTLLHVKFKLLTSSVTESDPYKFPGKTYAVIVM